MIPNPLLNLTYEPEVEKNLGEDYYDVVTAAKFPIHILRFRNNHLLPILNLEPQNVSNDHFIEAFGQFDGKQPCLALRYHGYQFGQYNPFLGDGRGFLYGQVRGNDHNLYDFGTKGSGITPYSRSADGRLTLKGGVREILAAEALHQLGVRTSRCLSMIETGESLWRGDEPSPTRSCVMVRFSRSHIRFGTFERLHYLKRPDLIQKLLDRVIATYYPHIAQESEKYALFFAELVTRVAELAAQWMAAGFCHGVLNTDNMSITGESFDYGPYAFIDTYNPQFTAAYFDYGGRYSYGNQPFICKLNLEMLQLPLAMIMSSDDLEAGIAQFDDCHNRIYEKLMIQKLGFPDLFIPQTAELLTETIKLLRNSNLLYHNFFTELTQGFNQGWRDDKDLVLENATFFSEIGERWKKLYHVCLNKLPLSAMTEISDRLTANNPTTALLRPIIESIWQPIMEEDDWQPFYNLLEAIHTKK